MLYRHPVVVALGGGQSHPLMRAIAGPRIVWRAPRRTTLRLLRGGIGDDSTDGSGYDGGGGDSGGGGSTDTYTSGDSGSSSSEGNTADDGGNTVASNTGGGGTTPSNPSSPSGDQTQYTTDSFPWGALLIAGALGGGAYLIFRKKRPRKSNHLRRALR